MINDIEKNKKLCSHFEFEFLLFLYHGFYEEDCLLMIVYLVRLYF